MTIFMIFKAQRLRILCTLFVLIWAAPNACGLILHDNNDPDPGWTDHPDPEVVGAYHNYASCVAIAPNYIVTSRHAGIPGSLYIKFGGVRYEVSEIYEESTTEPVDPYTKPVDLRIMKLQNADLDSFVLPHNGSFSEIGKEMFMAGRGARRKDPYENGSQEGYTWSSVDTNQLTFGSNRFDANSGYMNSGTGGELTSDTIRSDFDALDNPFRYPTEYEASMGGGDSGSGWFVKNTSGQWFLAGIGIGVSHLDYSFYEPSSDCNWAVKISTYHDWIESVVDRSCPNHRKTDMDDNCVVDSYDFKEFLGKWMSDTCTANNNYCTGADTNGPDANQDGVVNYFDAVKMFKELQYSPFLGDGPPSPTSSVQKLNRAYQIAKSWVSSGGMHAEEVKITMTAVPPAGAR